MHDLTLKPGKRTTEFMVLAVSVIVQWTTVILSVLTDVVDVIPEENKPLVLVAIVALTSLQTTAYSIQRGNLKKAAVEGVAGYNATLIEVEKLLQASGGRRFDPRLTLPESVDESVTGLTPQSPTL